MSDQGIQPPIQKPRNAIPASQVAPPPPLPPPRVSSGFPTWAIVLTVLGGCCIFALIPAGIMARAHAQDVARRASCWKNLQLIGITMVQYAGDHDDYFMPLVDAEGNLCPVKDENDSMKGDVLRNNSRSAFAILLKNGYLTTPKVFICPSSKDQMPPDTFPTDFKKANLKDLILGENNCSYGWDPTKKHTVDVYCAILADKPRKTPGKEGTAANNSENHGGEGQNVWHNDGHVEWRTKPTPYAGDDPDIYTGSTAPNSKYWQSRWDAKIIR